MSGTKWLLRLPSGSLPICPVLQGQFSLLASQSDDCFAYLFEYFTCKLSLVAKQTALLQLQNTTLNMPSRNATTDKANKHSVQAAWKRNLRQISWWGKSSDSNLYSGGKGGSGIFTFEEGRRKRPSDKNGGKHTRNKSKRSLLLLTTAEGAMWLRSST